MYYNSYLNTIRPFLLGIIIFAIIAVIWEIIIEWRIFVKAGEKGWKALIPIYDVITFIKIIDASQSTMVVYFVILAASLLSSAFGFGALSGALGIFYMSLNFRMAKHFGRSDGFAIGAALLWAIFGGILAFSKKTVPAPNQSSELTPAAPIAPASQPITPAAPVTSTPVPTTTEAPVAPVAPAPTDQNQPQTPITPTV